MQVSAHVVDRLMHDLNASKNSMFYDSTYETYANHITQISEKFPGSFLESCRTFLGHFQGESAKQKTSETHQNQLTSTKTYDTHVEDSLRARR